MTTGVDPRVDPQVDPWVDPLGSVGKFYRRQAFAPPEELEYAREAGIF